MLWAGLAGVWVRCLQAPPVDHARGKLGWARADHHADLSADPDTCPVWARACVRVCGRSLYFGLRTVSRDFCSLLSTDTMPRKQILGHTTLP